MQRYSDEVAPKRGGSHWGLIRLKALKRDPIASRRIVALGHGRSLMPPDRTLRDPE